MVLPLDSETTDLLQRFGFDGARFEQQQQALKDGVLGAAANRISGQLEVPSEADVRALPPKGSSEHNEWVELGNEAIRKGEVGAITLAGGMATRFGGVVKASVTAIDDKSFLELKLLDVQHAAKVAGGRIPVYLMSSFATHDAIDALATKFSSDAVPVVAFPQFISLRMTPTGDLFKDSQGSVSPYAPGHGDLSFALRRAGILDSFREAGGKYLFMGNVDNLMATIDPAVIGAHIASGKPISTEVVAKNPGDKGGAPARVDNVLQIVEGFRFPESFDQESIPVFNTNTFVMTADAIDNDFDLDWFAVSKKVDGQPVVQFERLVGQVTAFLPCVFLKVSRDGDTSRFQPVKDPAELERRKDAIKSALVARGILA